MKKSWLYLLGSIVIALPLLGGWWFTREPETGLNVFENDPLVLEQKPLSEEVQSDPLLEVPLAKTETVPAAVESSIIKETSQSPLPEEIPKTSNRPEDSDGVSSVLIRDRLITFGHRAPGSPRSIDTIVLHASYNASGGDAYNFEKIIGQYEQYGVGAHYIIDRSGTVYRLVKEEAIAYHAGESKMPDGRKNVNDFSIGIELIATEESGYTEKQYIAVNNLIADIKTRHTIKDIVGHGDVAPKRKTDPWKFDWKKLE